MMECQINQAIADIFSSVSIEKIKSHNDYYREIKEKIDIWINKLKLGLNNDSWLLYLLKIAYKMIEPNPKERIDPKSLLTELVCMPSVNDNSVITETIQRRSRTFSESYSLKKEILKEGSRGILKQS